MTKNIITKKSIEALSLKQARKIFSGQKVSRYFPRSKTCEGGYWEGVIKTVERNLPNEDGTVEEGFLFFVKYEDDDTEHLDVDGVLKWLQDKPAAEARFVELRENANNRAADHRSPKRPRAAPAREAFDHENLTSKGTQGRSGSAQSARGRAAREAHGDGREDHHAGPGPSQKPRSGAPVTQTQTFLTGTLNDASASITPIPYREDGTRNVGLPGHLKRIEVIDFMCHHHMEMDFSPHVTFVSGSNGSGKSASLQALQCCLGVQARKTGRASSMKGFIRTGAHEAIVRVTVWNRPYAGKDAFMHEIYGDSITVERRISHSGSSNWALKDFRGKTVGRRRDDLDAMLQVLGINAANPVTVMTQDTARSFLAGTSSKADQEKYSLYMDCTQLGSIAENLLEAQSELKQMEAHVDKIKESYERLEQERNVIKGKVEGLNCITAWRDEVEAAEKVLAWRVVEEEESKVADLEQSLVSAPSAAEELEEQVEALRGEVATLNEGVEQMRTFLESFETKAEELNGKEIAARAEVKKAKTALNKLTRSVNDLEEKLQREEAAKRDLETAAEQADESMAEDTQAVQQQYLKNVNDATEAHRAAQVEVQSVEEARKAADAAENQARRECDDATNRFEAANKEVSELEKTLNGLRNTRQGSSVQSFGGPAMAKLVNSVQNAVKRGQFHRCPIGPVGQYLELADKRWGMAIETCLWYNLNAMLVHDQHDQKLINKLIQEAGFDWREKPQTCVMRLDLPQHTIPASAQPAAHIPTVLRMIRVNDSAVEAPIMNFLVDMGKVERIALAQSFNEGAQLVRERNVMTVFETDGCKRYKRGLTESREQRPDYMHRKPLRLGASVKDQTQQLQQSIGRAKQDVVTARKELDDALRAWEAAKIAHKEARFAVIARRKVIAETQTALDLVRSQAPPELLATQADGSQEDNVYETEILNATQAVLDIGGKVQDAKTQLAEAEEAFNEAKAELEAVQEEHRRLKEENKDFADNFEDQAKLLSDKRSELQSKESEQQQTAEERARTEQALEEARQLVEQTIEMATEGVCTREDAAEALEYLRDLMRERRPEDDEEGIDRFLTRQHLETKVDRLTQKINKKEREAGGSLAELEQELADAQSALDGEGARQKMVLELYNNLLQAYRRREKKFKEVDESVEQEVQHRFNHYMRRKGHYGKLKLDRSSRSLTLSVQIGEKQGGKDNRVKDLKQLSGGERSYTTVAFTLALGSTTEMPFRAMDEFDVFMDSVNRRTAMENLLQFAKEQPDLQFVFLTPQDMAAVDEAKKGCEHRKCHIPDDFIKIVKMKPARPNATRA